jgi:N-acetylmuramoyl-L-alanine amidase
MRTLTIDAGHGGDDAGAKGPGGTLEKDVTLAIARRLKSAVESRIGLRVLMTRDDDRALGVAERAAFANSNQADLFVSLHANASFRPSVAGAAVYVARFEDNAMPGGARTAPELLPVFGGGMRDVELVPWSLAQIRHRDQSLALAKLVSDQLGQHVALAPRAVDAAPLRVLESANMPAVLVEVGYLTNPEQETQLTSAEVQTQIAQSIVDALLRFRGGQASDEGGR